MRSRPLLERAGWTRELGKRKTVVFYWHCISLDRPISPTLDVPPVQVEERPPNIWGHSSIVNSRGHARVLLPDGGRDLRGQAHQWPAVITRAPLVRGIQGSLLPLFAPVAVRFVVERKEAVRVSAARR